MNLAAGRLLYNEDGKSLDEIVFDGSMHLEQEDDDAYYLAIYDQAGDRHSLFSLYAEPYIGEDEDGNAAVKVRLMVTDRDVDRGQFPLVQRHMTQDEADAAAARAKGADPEWHITLKDERPDR